MATLYKVVEVLSLSDYILSVFFSNTRQSMCLYVLEENRKESGWYTRVAKLQTLRIKKRKKELKVKQNKKEKRRRSYILSVMLMQKKTWF
jgi:hypothetical protein